MKKRGLHARLAGDTPAFVVVRDEAGQACSVEHQTLVLLFGAHRIVPMFLLDPLEIFLAICSQLRVEDQAAGANALELHQLLPAISLHGGIMQVPEHADDPLAFSGHGVVAEALLGGLALPVDKQVHARVLRLQRHVLELRQAASVAEIVKVFLEAAVHRSLALVELLLSLTELLDVLFAAPEGLRVVLNVCQALQGLLTEVGLAILPPDIAPLAHETADEGALAAKVLLRRCDLLVGTQALRVLLAVLNHVGVHVELVVLDVHMTLEVLAASGVDFRVVPFFDEAIPDAVVAWLNVGAELLEGLQANRPERAEAHVLRHHLLCLELSLGAGLRE
mmetsp:Transcript_80957/g.188075  ORF Transcript_80957/g.188075 Transcript_80957/m.188075 type:complete len:335 (-) Transcript_80957:1752-2756(-)